MKFITAPFLFLVATAASSIGLAQAPAQGSAPLPGQIIYLPQLPSAESLTSTAQAQGMSIASIRQTSTEELVTYHFSAGPDSLVAYRVLPNGGGAQGPAAMTSAAVATPSTAQPAVVYTQPTTTSTYYYDSGYPYYYGTAGYPWGWYGVGFGGWYGGYGWGGYRGGYGGYHGGFGGGFARGGGGFGHGGGHR